MVLLLKIGSWITKLVVLISLLCVNVQLNMNAKKLVLNFVNFIAGMILINLSTINSGDI